MTDMADRRANERAVLHIADALRDEIAHAPHNSIITIMVKIENGRVSEQSSMDARRFPLKNPSLTPVCFAPLPETQTP